MLLFMAGFSSCKKDSFKPVNDESGKGKSTKVNVVQHSYADFILLPRQPGETLDTYKCVFSGAEVVMRGTPSWNTALYPTLQNGVPALWGSYSVTEGSNSINSYISGGEDFVLLTVGSTNGINLIAFQNALDKYSNAVSQWSSGSSGGYPAPSDYIQSSYTAAPISVTGKLIRVTTGSHWALATIDYPLPTAAPITIPNATFQVVDPDHTTDTYFLSGSKGVIASGTLRGTSIQATGNYTHTDGTGIFHYHGRVYRADGTYFDFDITQDLS
ncbi:hypothetical protein [Mucilaginibacter sp. NFR10]|uniref:hypothetical protein n=1 Tax=Mucilaginibacter sp. NFR10 TaxID=1566292 RepID=UPI0008719D2F|nr:hypothetical protein [Mucilaginibacter sp. NFR10]SCW76534.1 hypothetical protein SAMN03159284_03907 [Mucilaginibacter sp. NFR10]